MVRRAGLLAMALAATTAVAAHAALGGASDSVERDRSHFAARMGRATVGTAHVVTLAPANGGTVREFSTADGIVFAVAWRGPARPDLRQLLGDRFADASAEMAARHGRRVGRALRIDQAGLVVHSEGHPGAFSGVAYDPRLVPTGFAIDDLR